MTFSVAKLCPIKHWQAKCHKRRRQQVFDVLSMLCWKLKFLHLSSYHIKNYQDFLRKKNSCSLSFNPRQENDKMLQHRRQKKLFDVLSMLCWKLKFLLLSSYHNKKLLRFFLKKQNHALCHLLLGKKMIKCCNTEDLNKFLMFWACFFENKFLYTHSATLLGLSKIIYRKKLFEINCWEINNKLS